MTYEIDQLGKRSIVVTPRMEAMRQSVERHLTYGAMMAWVGAPGTGKTTTARWLANGMALGTSFTTGHYFNAPPMPSTGGGNLALRLYDSLLADLTGTPPRRAGRGQPSLNTVAREILAVMSVKNVSTLCIDEAGTLHPQALEGLIYIQDEAQCSQQEFVCILIGMTGLPEHLRENPRLNRRVKVQKRFASLTEQDFVGFSRGLWQLEGIRRPADAEEEAFIARLFAASGGNINVAVELMRDVTDVAETMGKDRPGVGTLNAVARLRQEDVAEVMASKPSAATSRAKASRARQRKSAVVAVGGEG